MKHPGGYSLSLTGRPGAEIDSPCEPGELFLPLTSRRFNFSEITVQDGEDIRAGRILARDPANHGVPLLAPRAGKARLNDVPGCIHLVDLTPAMQGKHAEPSGWEDLLDMGVWQFFSDASTGELPDPMGAPRAVIVSTVNLEPYVTRGDIQLVSEFGAFIRGLKHIQSRLAYQAIHLVVPDVDATLAEHIHEAAKGLAWIKVYTVPLRYPSANPRLVTRRLGGFEADAAHPVWATDVAGVLAVERAMSEGLACLEHVISLGGPAAPRPRHLRIPPGYPLAALLHEVEDLGAVRVIDGGVFTGVARETAQTGLDVECRGLTLLAENETREFLGFLRPGLDRTSYSNCFLGSLCRGMAESLTTAIKGDRRACVACTSCERVCPAGIMPHAIHKYLYRNVLEEAERLRVDLCIGCGLCSYVCPSKIELSQELQQASETIRQELSTAEGVTNEAAS